MHNLVQAFFFLLRYSMNVTTRIVKIFMFKYLIKHEHPCLEFHLKNHVILTYNKTGSWLHYITHPHYRSAQILSGDFHEDQAILVD